MTQCYERCYFQYEFRRIKGTKQLIDYEVNMSASIVVMVSIMLLLVYVSIEKYINDRREEKRRDREFIDRKAEKFKEESLYSEQKAQS